MTIDPSTFINVLLITTVMSVLGIIALFIYSFIKKEQEAESVQDRTLESYEMILRRADTKAAGMLDKAQTTSEHILGDTRKTNEHITEELDRVMQLIAQKHISSLNMAAGQFQKNYESSLAQLQAKLTEQSQETARLTESRIIASLETFTQSLMSRSSGAQEQVNQKAQALLMQVDKEIAEYKKAQLEKIQTQTQSLLEKTFHGVLQRSIPESVQKELILESLEKAKEEGIFG